MMKTVKETISVLTKKQQKEFLENNENYDIDEILNHGLSFLLISAFTWDNTNQGYDYWNKIYKKHYDND